MINTLKSFVNQLYDTQLQQQAMECLKDINTSNPELMADFIINQTIQNADCVRYANLIQLVSPVHLTPVNTLQLAVRLVQTIQQQIQLRVQLNNAQTQDILLLSLHQNQQMCQLIGALQYLGKAQPRLLLAYLLYFWPDDMRAGPAATFKPIEISLQNAAAQAEELLQQFSASLLTLQKEFEVKPFSAVLAPGQIAPSSVLVQMMGCCLTPELAPVILPLVMAAAPTMGQQAANMQVLALAAKCLEAVDAGEALGCYAQLAMQFLQFLHYYIQNGTNNLIRMQAVTCVAHIMPFVDLQEAGMMMPAVAQQLIKQLDSMANAPQQQTQILTDSQALLRSPALLGIFGYNPGLSLTGDMASQTLTAHSYDIQSQIPVNAERLLKQQDTYSAESHRFIKSNLEHQYLATIEGTVMQTNQIKQILLYSFNCYAQNYTNQVFTKLRHNILSLFIQLSKSHLIVLTQFLQQQIQSTKVKPAVLQMILDILADLEATQFQNVVNLTELVQQLAFDFIVQDLKFVPCEDLIKYKVHDLMFFQKDVPIKQQFEPTVSKIIFTLFRNNLVNTKSSLYFSLLNFLFEAACGIVSQRESPAGQYVTILSSFGYAEPLYLVAALNMKNRFPEPGDGPQSALASINSRLNIMSYMASFGDKINSEMRIRILMQAQVSFVQLFGVVLISLINAKQQNSYAIQLLRQIIEECDSDVASKFYNSMYADGKCQGSFLHTTGSFSEFFRKSSNEMIKICEKGPGDKLPKLKMFNEMFPGQRWRTYQTGLELMTNQQNVQQLTKFDDELEDDSVTQSVSNSQLSIVESPSINTDMKQADMYWISIQIYVHNVLSVLNNEFSTELYTLLNDSKYIKSNIDIFYKSVFSRLLFICTSKLCENIDFSYEILTQQKQALTKEQQFITTFISQLLQKIDSDGDADNLKYLVQVIASTNMIVMVAILRGLNSQGSFETSQLSYSILVHSIPIMAIKSIVNPLIVEANEQSNKQQISGIYVKKVQYTKYLIEILCSLCLELSKTTLVKSAITTIANVIKSVRYFSLFTQIDTNQLNTCLTPILQSLFLIGGFPEVQCINNSQKVIPTDPKSYSYHELAKHNNYNELIGQIKESFKTRNLRYIVSEYQLPSQYEKILEQHKIAHDNTGVKNQMGGAPAHVCKLHQQVLEAFAEILAFVKLPFEMRRLILAKSLALVQIHYNAQGISTFFQNQLMPRILLVVIRMLESQTNVQQFQEIIEIFSDLIQNSNCNEVYTQIFNRFLTICVPIVLSTAHGRIALKKASLKIEYQNPVLVHTRYIGAFGLLPSISNYILPFLRTCNENTFQFLIHFDTIVKAMEQGSIIQLDVKKENIINYICDGFSIQQLVSFCQQLIEGPECFMQNSTRVLNQIYQVYTKQFGQDEVCSSQLLDVTFDVCFKQKAPQQLLLASLPLMKIQPRAAYILLQKYLTIDRQKMFAILKYCVFRSDSQDFTLQFVKQLHDDLMSIITSQPFSSFEQDQYHTRIQIILDQLKVIIVDFTESQEQYQFVKDFFMEKNMLQQVFTSALLMMIQGAQNKKPYYYQLIDNLVQLVYDVFHIDIRKLKLLIVQMQVPEAIARIDSTEQFLQELIRAPQINIDELSYSVLNQAQRDVSGARHLLCLIKLLSVNGQKDLTDAADCIENVYMLCRSIIKFGIQEDNIESVQETMLHWMQNPQLQTYCNGVIIAKSSSLKFSQEQQQIITLLCIKMLEEQNEKAKQAALVLCEVCSPQSELMIRSRADLLIMNLHNAKDEIFKLVSIINHNNNFTIKAVCDIGTGTMPQKLLEMNYVNKQFVHRKFAYEAMLIFANNGQMNNDVFLDAILADNEKNVEDRRILMQIASKALKK